MRITSLTRRNPASPVQRELDRVFDDFLTGFTNLIPFEDLEKGLVAGFSPKVNVSETKTEIKVSAELPGIDEKDIKVDLDEDVLTITGERKTEHSEEGKHWHRIESSYGSFQRVVPLTAKVDAEKVKAEFRKGVLDITLPKRKEEQEKRKTITIETK